LRRKLKNHKFTTTNWGEIEISVIGEYVKNKTSQSFAFFKKLKKQKFHERNELYYRKLKAIL